MPGGTDKVRIAKEGVTKYKTYEACLMRKANSDAIIDALAVGNYSAIQKIFEDCKVPEEDRNELLQFAINCYEMRYHQW